MQKQLHPPPTPRRTSDNRSAQVSVRRTKQPAAVPEVISPGADGSVRIRGYEGSRPNRGSAGRMAEAQAVGERAADLRPARTISATSPKTISYRAASPVEGMVSFRPSKSDPREEQRQRSAKLPPFDPIFPLFEHDMPCHGLTARTADRAVLVRLRRFLAVHHVICTSTYKQEVAGSNPAAPIELTGFWVSGSR